MESLSCKTTIREEMREIRDKLSPYRRVLASHEALKSLKKKTRKKKVVLSYSSFQSELCLNELNQWLSEHKTLVLPRVIDSHLSLFCVRDLSADLTMSSWGIAEPNPKNCEEVPAEKLDFALIPALAFDSSCYRLGYGKGFYDRLLSLCKAKFSTVGVGFREQLISCGLPVESHDQPLNSIALF